MSPVARHQTTAGALRHRVTVQALTLVEDGSGGHVEDYRDVREVWANVTPLSSGQRIAAMANQLVVTHRVRLRALPGIPEHVQFTHRGRVFVQRGPRLDVDEAGQVWEVMVEETGAVPPIEEPESES
jgi:SPP1 family predicted phage head-tail adaptor